MKTLNLLLSLLLALFAWSTANANDLSDSQLTQQSVFVLAAKDGTVKVIKDFVAPPATSSKSELVSSEALASLETAWKKCYSAILLNDQSTSNVFFESNLPLVLQGASCLSGIARIKTLSLRDETIRVVAEFTFEQPGNGTLAIHDAQIWRRNKEGEWRVQSMIY